MQILSRVPSRKKNASKRGHIKTINKEESRRISCIQRNIESTNNNEEYPRRRSWFQKNNTN
jgi:hypothetical protein